MKGKFRNHMCLLMVGIAVVFFTGVAYSQRPKLNFWAFESMFPAEREHFKKVAEEFATMKGVDVEVTFVSYFDMPSKLLPAIEAGNPPDLAELMYFHAVNFKDAALDITPVWEKIGKMYQSWLPWARMLLSDGKAYCIPYGGGPEILHVRKDRLAEAGVDIPETWEDLRKAAIKTNRPEEGIYGYGQPMGGRTWDAEKPVRALLWSYGQSIVAEDGKTIVFDTPETRRLIKWYTDLYLKDKVIPPGATAWGGADNNTFYQTGRSNMCINLGSLWLWIKKNDPELRKNTALVPTPAGSKGRFTYGALWVIQTYKDSKHPELTKEFIEYFFSKDVYDRFWREVAGCISPPLRGIMKHEAFEKAPDDIWARIAPTCTMVGYPGPVTPAASEIISKFLLTDLLGQICVDNWTVEKAIADFVKKVKEIYAKYQ